MFIKEKLKILTQERIKLTEELKQLQLNYTTAIHTAKEYDELKRIVLNIKEVQLKITNINNKLEDLLKEPT